jgi:hypothetical protein
MVLETNSQRDGAGASQEEWNEKVRGETEVQRLDRNFGELLQELRVAQTGVQILFAFLLTLAFTPRFGEITAFQRDLYITTLLLTTASTGLLIAPVAYHRLTFRQRMRAQLVRAANRFAIGGLTFLMLALGGSVLFISDVVLSRGPAILFTLMTAGWFLLFWYLLPIVQLIRRQNQPGPDGDPAEPGD